MENNDEQLNALRAERTLAMAHSITARNLVQMTLESYNAALTEQQKLDDNIVRLNVAILELEQGFTFVPNEPPPILHTDTEEDEDEDVPPTNPTE